MKVNPYAKSDQAHQAANQTKDAMTRRAERAEKIKADQLKEANSQAAVNVGDATNIDISSRAKEMASAKEIANAAPDVRAEKLEKLKAKIASGEYQVKSEDLAERLVDEHLRSHIG